MKEKNQRLPLSEEEFNDLDLALRRSEELRILVRFMMKQSESNLFNLRQMLIGLGMSYALRTFRICSESFSELNQ